MKKTAGARADISGKGLKIGIVVGRFNDGITKKLLDGAEKPLRAGGVARIDTVWVPGAFEIPLMLRKLAGRKSYEALIALGAVVRGGTPHFDYVCDGATY